MSELDQIVQIVLFRGSTPVETASFSIPLILSIHDNFVERTREYNSMTAVAEDFDPVDGAYQVAEALFGQSSVGSPVTRLVIGRRNVGEDIVDAYDAIKVDNGVFYAVFTDSHDPVEVEALSDAVATDRRIFGTSTDDPAVPTSASTTDIAAVLSAKSAGRTFGIYLPTADVEYPEAAWAGSQLAYTPGSNDWDFKRANNITVSKLSDNERAVLRTKNINMYTRVAGVNIFQDGNMFDGTAIDIVIGEDWLYARLQEGVYFRLINTQKIPMTNTGLVMIENEIRAVLSLAEKNGLIDRGWTVTVPDVMSIPENLRAQRTAGVFRFDARLQGSIRSVRINGYLSV